jgi:hypothetical protein
MWSLLFQSVCQISGLHKTILSFFVDSASSEQNKQIELHLYNNSIYVDVQIWHIESGCLDFRGVFGLKSLSIFTGISMMASTQYFGWSTSHSLKLSLDL